MQSLKEEIQALIKEGKLKSKDEVEKYIEDSKKEKAPQKVDAPVEPNVTASNSVNTSSESQPEIASQEEPNTMSPKDEVERRNKSLEQGAIVTAGQSEQGKLLKQQMEGLSMMSVERVNLQAKFDKLVDLELSKSDPKYKRYSDYDFNVAQTQEILNKEARRKEAEIAFAIENGSSEEEANEAANKAIESQRKFYTENEKRQLLSRQRNDFAVQELTKSGIEDFQGGGKALAKSLFGARTMESDDQYVADINSDVKREIIALIDERTIDKIWKGGDQGINIEDKNELIFTAKENVLNKFYEGAVKDLQDQNKVNEAWDANAERLNADVAKYKEPFEAEIKALEVEFEKLGEVNENSTPEVIDKYNLLVEKNKEIRGRFELRAEEFKQREELLNKQLAEINAATEDADKRIENYELEIGYDALDQKFSNNFGDLDEKWDKYKNRFYNKAREEGASALQQGFYDTLDAGLDFLSGGAETAVNLNPFYFAAKIGIGLGEISESFSPRMTDDYSTANRIADVFFGSDLFTQATSDKGSEFTSLLKRKEAGLFTKKGFDEALNTEITYRNVTKSIGQGLPYMLGIMKGKAITNVDDYSKTIAKTLKNTRLKGTNLAKAGKVKDYLRMIDVNHRLMVFDSIAEGEEMGMSKGKAIIYGNVSSLVTGLSQTIMPDANFMKSVVGQGLLKNFSTSLSAAANMKAAKLVTLQFIKNVGKEIGEEELDLLLQEMIKGGMMSEYNSKFLEVNTQRETVLGTISLTGLVGGAAARKQFRTAKNSIIKNHRKDQKGISAQFQAEIDGLQKKINSTTTDRRLNENTRKSRLEKLNSTLESTTKARVYSDQLANAMNVAPKYVTNEQLHLVTERNILLEEKKNTDPALTKDIDAKLEANQKLMEESTVNKKGNEILDKTIATVEKLNPNQKFEVAENEEDSERIITEINEQNIQWNKENPDNQVQVLSDAEIQDAMLQEGFNLNGTKVINKHIARASGATNVAGHEFLHDILAETLNFDPESAKEIGGALTNLLISMDPEQFTDSKFVKKLRLYQTFQKDILNIVEQNPEASEAELTKLIEEQVGRDVHSQAIEAITLASDAFATGDIYFGDLAKRGSNDVLRRFKQNLQGTMFDKWSMDVEFNDAEDVFNFIKDYNYSIRKGKLTKAQEALLKSKAKGKLMTGVDNRYVGIKKLQESKNFEAAKEISPKGKEYIEFGFDNKSLVDIINSKSSSAEERFGGVDALVEKNWPVISNAIKFNPTGEISMGAIKEAVSEQMLGIFPEVTLQDGRKVKREGKRLLDTYNKTTEVTTFLSSTLGPRAAEILTRGKQIDAVTRGVSLDEATGLQDDSAQPLAEESSTYEKGKTKIDILKDFAKVPGNKIISLAKPVKGDKFKEIISKYAGKTGELIFNIPAKKIMEGGANLIPTTKIKGGMAVPSEALNIQRFFSAEQNLEKFVKTMPLYNVTEMTADINKVGENIDVSRDTYGVAIGLKGLPLNYFYEDFTDPTGVATSPKGRSKGLTSQTPVKKLKQKFRKPSPEVLEQLRKDLGITPTKQRNEYTRDIGQLLKGVAKVYSINASLSGAQRNQEAKLETAKPEDVKAIKQQTADITAAQSKIAFSKSGNIVASDEIVKVMFAKASQGKKAAEAFGYDHLDLNKEEAKEEFIDWVKNVGSKVRPRSFWEANGNLIGSGAKYTKQLEQNLIDLADELDYYEDFEPITRVELNLGAAIEAIQDGDARAKKRLSTFKESVNDLLKKGKLPRGLKPLLIKASKIETVKKYPLKSGGSISNNDANFNSKEVRLELLPAGKMVFANVDQMNEAFKGVEFAPENKNIKDSTKRITLYGKKTGEQVKKLIDKKKDFLNNSDKGFVDTWMAIAKDIDQNPDNRRFWAAWLEVTPQNMSHFMRVGARLSFYNTLGLKNVEEHTSPATDFAFALWAFANSRDKKGNQILTESLLKKSMESYIQGSLPKVFDDLLKGDGFDYVATIPKEYRLQVIAGEIPVWIRYINPQVNAQKYTLNGVEYSGVNPNVIILANGKTLAQSYGLGVDSSLEMNQDVISVQQELLFKVFTNNITKAEAVSQLNDYVSNMIPAASSITMFSKNIDANKANVNPKGITILDFDDTLATTKSGVRYTMPNPSGKPQPRRKAILIAGNAGAGKTTVINQLGLRKQGFKYVNQDIALDWLTKNNGLPKDMNEFTREQAEKWRELGGQAAVAAKNKASKLRGQGDGVVIDGTGAVGVQFESMAREFKDAGYDVQIVFIESSLETALERNANRSERRLTDATVRNAYESTQKNKKAFKEMVSFFPYSAKGFVEINTDNLKQGGALPSNLVETMDNFTKGYIKGRLNAEEFASQGQTLLGEGAEFDFSEFNKVVEGKTAPLFNKAMKLQGKFGPENMFVLTARPAEAQGPIFDFLKANGLNIPLKNITGLGNSTAEAKALWVAGKFSEGYNDFYFADDAIQNVKAVDNILEQFDVKRKVQQAKIQFSKTLDPKFNEMLERSAGVGAQKIFSRVEAAKRGKNKGKFTFFVPPSAEDFTGLLRYFVGTGKQGDADIQFFNEALVKPFARADRAMSQMKQTIRDDYSALRKKFPDVKKKLGKLVEGTTFTNDMAIRVYLFDKAGYEIPGLSKQGKAKLLFAVKADPEMRAFADALGIISKQEDGYLKPGEYWNTENIALDLQNATNKVGRKQFLQEWVQNKEVIFSPANMNKIEAVYGTQFREALEDVLFRMENGTNRSKGKTYGQNWTNWVNNSVGAIMFFNARSAVLQTLSTVNFINFEDNNIFAAGKAFANQKQYWSDFSFLFNSDFLRNRRAGLATNVNEAELASAVAGATNKAKAALGYLLKIGFTPTQIADSFAIASGGATYYRNRIKTYLKSGLSQEQAEARAMLDFQEIAEETQQSARPDRISQQQASPLGRIILAFANTPMQYNRLIKKAAGDLVNKRGDWRSNVSRILYYGAIQNFIFASLQNALFALAFDDDDEELTESQQAARDRKEDTKNSRILNSMFDSLARGSGVYGAVLATIKNAIFELYEQEEKGYRADYNQVVIELLNVSPPIGSKVRKLASAGYTRKSKKDVMEEMSMLDYDNPAWQSIGNVVEATTNIPMARAIRKTDNLREAFNQENSAMQRVFLALGWSAWDLSVGTEVVKNEGKKNEYVVTLDTKRMNQEKAKNKIDEDKRKQKKEDVKKKKANQNRCTKMKSDGFRCSMMVNKPKTRCHFHD